ncbi:MAG: divisome protein SepX/GlpR [Nocardioidaceae bacterium]
MDLSGIIFVALAIAWAVYLVPKALKHHDEVARTRSIDRFSTAMRVLARREPVSRRDSRLVVTPARGADNPRVLVPSATPVAEAAQVDAPPAAAAPRPLRPASQRAAARAAARRRRHILSFLLLADLVVAVLAGLAVLAWWSVAIPVALTLLYLVLCRTQVRRDQVAGWDREIVASAEAEPAARRRAARVEVREGVRYDEFDDAEDTVAIDVALLDAVAVTTEDGGSLWDPLPMTLPTYVTKPKARRTVRTIDLNEPNTWTSGRTEEDSRLVAETAAQAAEAEAEAVVTEQQRAVGS